MVIACTVATVFGEPPPNTNDDVPSVAPAPSCTAANKDPADLNVPVAGSSP